MAQPLSRCGYRGARLLLAGFASAEALERRVGQAGLTRMRPAAPAADADGPDGRSLGVFIGLAKQRRERPFAHARAFRVCHG